jgi:hypothetical protein
MRRKVAAAKAGGMSEDHIALALGITRPTLNKHFMAELTTGAAVKRMEVLDALFTAAKKGNAAAIGKVLLLGAAVTPAPQPGAPAPDQLPAPAPAAKLGKKEAQQVAAVGAADGTAWSGILPGSGRVQ